MNHCAATSYTQQAKTGNFSYVRVTNAAAKSIMGVIARKEKYCSAICRNCPTPGVLKRTQLLGWSRFGIREKCYGIVFASPGAGGSHHENSTSSTFCLSDM